MKKLNKKGFTLVELLAVIVILAVIMVITIPTVLGSMSNATDSAAKSAFAAVQKYVDDQVELCNSGLGTLAPAANIFVAGTCVVDSTKDEDIIKNAGYEDEFDSIEFETVPTGESLCMAYPSSDGQAKNCNIAGVAGGATDGYSHPAGTTLQEINKIVTTSDSQFGSSKEISK